MGWLELVRRGVVPVVLALVLAAPFWLPQFLWQDWILGPKGLPSDFSDSFQNLYETLNPRNQRSIGVWMPLALLLMIAVARARLSARAWAAIVVCLTLVALQTVYLYPVARRIPTFELSLFVWRLAFPTAFLAFGALLAGWREVGSPPRRAGCRHRDFVDDRHDAGPDRHSAAARWPTASKGMSDHRALVDYDRGSGIWGVHEFFPNYGSLPRACDGVGDAAKALYADLRAGQKAERPFLVVSPAPPVWSIIESMAPRWSPPRVMPIWCWARCRRVES